MKGRKLFIYAQILILPFLIISCLNTAEVSKRENIEFLNTHLGNEIVDIIGHHKSVEFYKINPKKEKNKEGPTNGYAVLAQKIVSGSSQIKNLQSILLDKKTYNFEYYKKGLLYPEFVLVFKGERKEFSLYIDFYRNELLFVFQKNKISVNFDLAKDKLNELIQDILMNNT